jgi:ribosomal protein L11 methyltransferase
MKWIKIKIETTPERLDEAVHIFGEAGLASLEIEDSREFLEVLEATRGRWDYVDESLYEEKSKACSVCAYVADNEAGKCTLDAIKGRLREGFELSVGILDEESWAETWKTYFKPVAVGENILICPVWEAVPDEYKARTVFRIDPGMSFGTGTHETTRLCVAALERHVKPDDLVLDLGCGSGILSIIACLLGAAATAADIDENSTKIARENANINNVPQNKYEVYTGDAITDKKLRAELSKNTYDLVLANIIPEVVIKLLPFIKDVLKKGGAAVLSGIIGQYLPDMEAAAAELGFEIIDITNENDWHCIEVRI